MLPVLKHHLRQTNQGAHPTMPGRAGVVIRGRGGVPVLLPMVVVRVPAGLVAVRGDGQGPRGGNGQGPRGGSGRAGRAGLGGGRRRGEEDDTRHGLLCLSAGEERRLGKEARQLGRGRAQAGEATVCVCGCVTGVSVRARLKVVVRD